MNEKTLQKKIEIIENNDDLTFEEKQKKIIELENEAQNIENSCFRDSW